jgi:AcrR family transcriptional regulator
MATAKTTTKERLLDAAERVFAEKGFYEAAVDEIVEVSGTSKGSVYFHFPSKESLFLAVMDHLGNRLVRRVEREARRVADPVERLDVALETTVRTLYRHKTLANLLLVKGAGMGPGFTEKRQEIFGHFSELTAELIREAVAAQRGDDADIDAGIAAHAWLGAVGELIVRWLETGRPDPMEESLPTLRLLLHRGLGLEPLATRGAA